MPSSTPSHIKFLLDENVSRALLRYLRDLGYDIAEVNKGTHDEGVAQRSLSEKRILITNDSDFTSYPKEQVYAVLWLRIPQSDKQALLTACDSLLGDVPDVTGCLIVLESEKWQILALPQ